LHFAVLDGRTEVAELLMERWPEGVMEKNQNGYTPLHLAIVMLVETEVVRLLVELWPEALNNFGKTPLQLLCFEEDLKRAGKLPLRDEEKEELISLLGGP
jgi:ankyrin repeat protein